MAKLKSLSIILAIVMAVTFSAGLITSNAFAKKTNGDQIVKYAKTLIGKPCKIGCAGPTYFDSSGFTQYVFGKYKHKLPRTAEMQSKKGRLIAKNAKNVNKAKKGDLLFYKKGNFTHVAIYAGKTNYTHQQIHVTAYNGKNCVQLTPVNSHLNYYKKVTIRRII